MTAGVVWGVPGAILLAGVAVSVVFMFVFQNFQPVQNHLGSRNNNGIIMHPPTSYQQQTIEMNTVRKENREYEDANTMNNSNFKKEQEQMKF